MGTMVTYTDSNLDKLPDLLRAADVVVTWNGKRYDLPVLEHLCGKLEIRDHCDLMLDCKAVLGWRPKLEYAAKATLGRGKSGQGDMAPDMFARGDWGKLVTYCAQDVALTRDLYLFAKQHGYLLTHSKSSEVPVVVQLRAVRPPNKGRREQTVWDRAARVGV